MSLKRFLKGVGEFEGAGGTFFRQEKFPRPLALPHPFNTRSSGLGKETRVHPRPGKTLPHGLALFGTDSKRQGQAEARPWIRFEKKGCVEKTACPC